MAKNYKLEFLMQIFRVGIIGVNKFVGQGISFAEFALLYAISESSEGKVLSGDLAKQLGMNVHDLKRILASLEKARAVKKEARGRDFCIAITDTGKKLFQSAKKLAEMRFEKLIPEDQSKNLEPVISFLEKIG